MDSSAAAPKTKRKQEFTLTVTHQKGRHQHNFQNKMSILDSVKFKSLVSSVLNKDIKQHGKNFMFDSEEDTAWNSNEGTPQWIALQFEEPQTVRSFSFQFQGGFVGKDPTVTVTTVDGTEYKEPFYPDDINSIQTFTLKSPVDNVKKLKFIFNSSTDFFGRIIVYKLKIL